MTQKTEKHTAVKSLVMKKGNLNVRGYIGVSMLGRTTFWVKVK